MKSSHILFFLALSCLVTRAQAQTDNCYLAAGNRNIPIHTPGTAKTTASTERLKARADYFFSPGSRTFKDSVVYGWSAGRNSGQVDGIYPAVDATCFDAAWQWDMFMKPYSKDLNTYTSSGKVIEHVNQLWDGAAWTNHVRTVYSYTGKDSLKLLQCWDGTNWRDSTRNIFRSVADTTTYLTENWDTGKKAWIRSSLETAHYTGGKLSDYLIQTWDTLGTGGWVNTSFDMYLYFGASLMEHSIQKWNKYTALWVNYQRIQYSYTGGGWLSTISTALWNNATRQWQDYMQDENFYTGTVITELHHRTWDAVSRAFQPSYKHIFTYDGTSVILEEGQNYSRGLWYPAYHASYAYDAALSMTFSSTDVFDGRMWRRQSESCYYYDDLTNISESSAPVQKAGIYPNPATTPQVYADYSTTNADPTTIALSDISGKTLFRTDEPGSIGDHSVIIPVADLAQGIYLVHIYSGDQPVTIIKLVK